MATLAAGDRPVRPLPIRARRAHGRLPTAIAARIALVLATLCGCTAGDRDGDGAAEAAASPEGGFPRVVALPGGESLRLERPPQRVLAANTAVVDTLTRLVAPERVAALCEQAFTWSRLAFTDAADPWRAVPMFHAFVAESVLARSPDLVLTTVHGNPETIAALRDIGIPVVRLPEPQDLAAAEAQVRLLGQLLGADGAAARLIEDAELRIARLAERDGPRRGRSVVWYTWYGTSGSATGSGTLADAAIRLAGMVNAAARAGRSGVGAVTAEELLAMDPDVLVVPADRGEASTGTRAILTSDAALAAIPAIRERRILELHPSHFSATSLEVVTAAEALAAAADRLLAGDSRR